MTPWFHCRQMEYDWDESCIDWLLCFPHTFRSSFTPWTVIFTNKTTLICGDRARGQQTNSTPEGAIAESVSNKVNIVCKYNSEFNPVDPQSEGSQKGPTDSVRVLEKVLSHLGVRSEKISGNSEQWTWEHLLVVVLNTIRLRWAPAGHGRSERSVMVWWLNPTTELLYPYKTIIHTCTTPF